MGGDGPRLACAHRSRSGEKGGIAAAALTPADAGNGCDVGDSCDGHSCVVRLESAHMNDLLERLQALLTAASAELYADHPGAMSTSDLLPTANVIDEGDLGPFSRCRGGPNPT